MKNLVFSFVLFILAVNTSPVYTFQFDDDYISKYNDKIPDGYYFNRSVRFGLPDTSIISLKIYNADGKLMETDSTRLGGGNYIFDLDHFSKKDDLKSGIYFVVMNAELNRIHRKIVEMKFTGKTKIIVVR